MVVKDTTSISEKGQITVPKRIREALALRPGAELHIELIPGGFVARKRVRQSPWRAAVGVLGAPGSTDRLVDRLRGRPDAVDR
jgi:AbrB family looped-hinge helix DNA binding protein